MIEPTMNPSVLLTFLLCSIVYKGIVNMYEGYTDKTFCDRTPRGVSKSITGLIQLSVVIAVFVL